MKRLALGMVLLAGIVGSASVAEAHLSGLLQGGCQKHYPPPPSQHFKRTKTHPALGAKLMQHLKDHASSTGGNCNQCPNCQ
jgi:hypothetical protein